MRLDLLEAAKAVDGKIMEGLGKIQAELRKRDITSTNPHRFWDEEYNDFGWRIVVYPWGLETPGPPQDALDVKGELAHSDTDDDKVMVALDLGTVRGAVVDSLEFGEFTWDVEDLRKQAEDFADPLNVREAVQRIQAYLAKARRNRPKGPREWSPHWDKPSMGAAKKAEIAPVAVNLVEHKGWGPWRSDELDERVQNLSDEFYQGLTEEFDECESLIEEILGDHYAFKADEGPRSWSPRNWKVGPVGVKKACKGLKDGRLESVDSMIRDAIQFMYEDALLPDDSDIRYAMDQTKEEFWEDPEFDFDIWGPLFENRNRTERGTMIGLMNKIQYSRDQGHYDRYLFFDLLDSEEIASLIHAWPVEDRGWVKDALQFHDMKDLRERFLEQFFRTLKKDMNDSDPDNRRDWDKHWKAMATDKNRAEYAQKEIREYLKTAPELPEDEE